MHAATVCAGLILGKLDDRRSLLLDALLELLPLTELRPQDRDHRVRSDDAGKKARKIREQNIPPARVLRKYDALHPEDDEGEHHTGGEPHLIWFRQANSGGGNPKSEERHVCVDHTASRAVESHPVIQDLGRQIHVRYRAQALVAARMRDQEQCTHPCLLFRRSGSRFPDLHPRDQVALPQEPHQDFEDAPRTGANLYERVVHAHYAQ
mmetsp:Transcript_23745/g.40630  ORF Transcript_23745/g.40630 Transcript_23745/m.40630 type:complete len:208 (-) Transcript_23745:92-715(-)